MILATKSLILFSSFAYLASQPARVRIASSSPFVEFYESHTHTVDMFIRASEQQHQAYGYTAESECVTITANVRILHMIDINFHQRSTCMSAGKVKYLRERCMTCVKSMKCTDDGTIFLQFCHYKILR